MSGLSGLQLDELCERVQVLLEKPWDAPMGRPRELTLREGVVMACGYMKNNMTEEMLGVVFGVDQSTVSRYICELTPLIEQATASERPTEEQAIAQAQGRVLLVDGTLLPCWSWRGHRELWSGKHATTGDGVLVVTNLRGDVIYVSDPAAGKDHDMRKLADSPEIGRILAASAGTFGDKGFIGADGIITPIRKPPNRKLSNTENEYNSQVSSLRAAVERAIAHIKAWRILHTDYRRPLGTFITSIHAAIGLYFYKLSFA
jgi:hypothetical protein